NILQFARTLRAAGMPVGPASIVDAVKAVDAVGLLDREDFYWTLHAVFVKKRDHHILFDQAFEIFWRSRNLVEKMLEMLSPVAPAQKPKEKPKAGETRVSQALSAGRERPASETVPEIEVDATLTVSGKELLQEKDFAQMTTEEINLAKAALRKLVLPIDKVKKRRLISAGHGQIDPRRTLQASLRAGGDIIDLRFRKPFEAHPPIVALCDISGSMSQYSRLFMHFLHALTERRRNVHSFLFGTRLTNVTRDLRHKDPDEALDAASGSVQDWSGGTRIAAALHEFNLRWSRRVLSGGAIVLLITDGLEREFVDDLENEASRLHRSCRQLIWLNPLLRFDGFEAKARGVRAILPHVDIFRSIHSLNAISDICTILSDKRVTKPASFLN
ncbi:MAG: VWA domain-containing protein, partial [Stappiaceae bacterium]